MFEVCYHASDSARFSQTGGVHGRGGASSAMPGTTSQPFGTLLRRYRTLAGLTQESLAERAGISTRAVSDLERGINRAPRAETLELIAAALALAPEPRAELIAAAHPDLDARPAATPAGPPKASSQLPFPPTSLIGREDDLLRGLRLLQRSETRLLTITGPGGVGKTHLALELARQCEPRFAAGARFVDLTTIRDAALVPTTLAQALELSGPPTGTLLDALKEALREQNILLLLDNVEHVADCAPTLAELLAACPHVSLLVTSRTPLHLRAEQVLDIAPLAVRDAATLFIARATARRDGVTLPPDAVSAICEQVDCLPLAIELCTAQLGALSLTELRQRLSAGLELPGSGTRDMPARHQTLRRTIGWSYDLLPPTTQALFRRLAVFAGGCALPAIQAVCVPSDDSPYDVLPDVMALVDASLLRTREVAGSARYQMLATIHDDASERLRDAGEYDQYARRHADYFAMFTGDEPSLIREMPNVRAALTWARDTRQNRVGLALQARFGRTWYLSGLRDELRAWQEIFLALDDASETPAPLAWRALALYGSARLAYDRGERDTAVTLAEGSLQAARRADDLEGMGNALAILGQIAQSRGEMEQASALFEESLIYARKSGISHVLSAALGNYAQVAQAQAKLALATSLLEEALTIARANDSLWGEALTLTHLGLLAFAQQHYPQARQHYASALALYRTFGSDVYLAWCLEAVAALDTAEGAHARATAISAGAESLRNSSHAPRPSGEQQAFEQALATCHETLGATAFAMAWEAGSAARRDALIRLALGEESIQSL